MEQSCAPVRLLKKSDLMPLSTLMPEINRFFSTGVIDPIVDTDHQRWDANDGSGYGITSSDYWNERYNGKLITEFEADKKLYLWRIFQDFRFGHGRGLPLRSETRSSISTAKKSPLTPDQIDVDDSGETIWFSNV